MQGQSIFSQKKKTLKQTNGPSSKNAPPLLLFCHNGSKNRAQITHWTNRLNQKAPSLCMGSDSLEWHVMMIIMADT